MPRIQFRSSQPLQDGSWLWKYCEKTTFWPGRGGALWEGRWSRNATDAFILVARIRWKQRSRNDFPMQSPKCLRPHFVAHVSKTRCFSFTLSNSEGQQQYKPGHGENELGQNNCKSIRCWRHAMENYCKTAVSASEQCRDPRFSHGFLSPNWLGHDPAFEPLETLVLNRKSTNPSKTSARTTAKT